MSTMSFNNQNNINHRWRWVIRFLTLVLLAQFFFVVGAVLIAGSVVFATQNKKEVIIATGERLTTNQQDHSEKNKKQAIIVTRKPTKNQQDPRNQPLDSQSLYEESVRRLAATRQYIADKDAQHQQDEAELAYQIAHPVSPIKQVTDPSNVDQAQNSVAVNLYNDKGERTGKHSIGEIIQALQPNTDKKDLLDKRVQIYRQDQRGTVLLRDLPDALNKGFNIEDATRDETQRYLDTLNPVIKSLNAGTYSALNQLGMGVPDILVHKYAPSYVGNMYDVLREENPNASLVGGAVGFILLLLALRETVIKLSKCAKKRA